jgi:hypothetical protein
VLPWPYVRVFALRTAIIWLALHVATLLVTGSLVFPFRSFVFALAITVTLVVLDAERRGERRFLANLGVSRVSIVLAILFTAAGFELLLRLLPGGWADS